MDNSTNTPAKALTLAELSSKLEAIGLALTGLASRIEALETSAKSTNKSDREMTDEDARRILVGDLAKEKHNEAAKKLGLSYGQIYSARLEYTFRHIHKELKARPEGFVNPFKSSK